MRPGGRPSPSGRERNAPFTYQESKHTTCVQTVRICQALLLYDARGKSDNTASSGGMKRWLERIWRETLVTLFHLA